MDWLKAGGNKAYNSWHIENTYSHHPIDDEILGEAEERYRVVARGSVFSHIRLLFTLLQNIDDIRGSTKGLPDEVMRVLKEEIEWRKIFASEGIRDISKMVALPANDFSVIDEKV